MQQNNPPHPGGFIKRVYLEPNKLGSNEVATKLGVNHSTFNRLINERSDMSPEMALKLSLVMGRTAESWLAMQNNYDLWKVKKEMDLSGYEPIKFTI